MPDFDFSILYRNEISEEGLGQEDWDVFISAYNKADRTQRVYSAVAASKKIWIMHHEYKFSDGDIPLGSDVFVSEEEEEDAFIGEFITQCCADDAEFLRRRICIDITGFMRPHLMFLVLALYRLGVSKFDVLYSEPDGYVKKEKTVFSQGDIVEVRPVNGMSGVMNPDTSNDLLIIGCGYDDKLIAEVAEHKDAAAKIQMYGFPPLRPDMYQQNIYRASQALEAIGEKNLTDDGVEFSPANDPFVTACVIQQCVAKHESVSPVTNIYLSPLSTKAQALGFALYYLANSNRGSISMLFPFSVSYSQETSGGISKIWRYAIDLPKFPQGCC